ncbi:MAG: S49 family peptidase, partial [Kiritimatiellaeota bacterium]|nr:S49 family peptidase [Kiritimatiellota bacterium]
MPSFDKIQQEMLSSVEMVRQKSLAAFAAKNGRNAIAYYSAFLTAPKTNGRQMDGIQITDMDMNGFMSVIHGMKKDKGLDLILHTPGGGV